jgi:hypothetical protein
MVVQRRFLKLLSQILKVGLVQRKVKNKSYHIPKVLLLVVQ